MINSYKKIVLVLFIGISFSGCDQTKVTELNEEIDTLNRQLKNLERENKMLNEDIISLRRENQSLRSELSKIKDEHRNLSDEQIIELLSDHGSFYCSGYAFENHRVRKVSDNIYDINFRYKDLNSQYSFGWSTGRARLIVGNNGTYSFNPTMEGPMCIAR